MDSRVGVDNQKSLRAAGNLYIMFPLKVSNGYAVASYFPATFSAVSSLARSWKVPTKRSTGSWLYRYPMLFRVISVMSRARFRICGCRWLFKHIPMPSPPVAPVIPRMRLSAKGMLLPAAAPAAQPATANTALMPRQLPTVSAVMR